jgi:hypothetical protein
VEDDVVNCETVKEEKCQDLTAGYTTEQKCSNWPKEVLDLYTIEVPVLHSWIHTICAIKDILEKCVSIARIHHRRAVP